MLGQGGAGAVIRLPKGSKAVYNTSEYNNIGTACTLSTQSLQHLRIAAVMVQHAPFQHR